MAVIQALDKHQTTKQHEPANCAEQKHFLSEVIGKASPGLSIIVRSQG